LSQENNTTQETVAVAISTENKLDEETQMSIQKLADALKSMADDVGQISELAAEKNCWLWSSSNRSSN
jgi:hypothetical protein